jgi:hypothetical protein
VPDGKIPFSIFQENRGQQLVVVSLGSEVSIFRMQPSIPNYKKYWPQPLIPINIYEQKLVLGKPLLSIFEPFPWTLGMSKKLILNGNELAISYL